MYLGRPLEVHAITKQTLCRQMTLLVKLFDFLTVHLKLKYSCQHLSPSKIEISSLISWKDNDQKYRPPDLPATVLRWCQLSLSGPMLTSLHSITRIYNTVFFRSVSAWVYHLSSRLIVYELRLPPLLNEVREPRKEQRLWQQWHLMEGNRSE